MKPKILMIPRNTFVPGFDNYRDAYLDVSVINITVFHPNNIVSQVATLFSMYVRSHLTRSLIQTLK
jgi:hypothetical protein